MTNSIESANTYTDLSGLAELKLAAKNNSPEALKAVAKQFEALFIQQMLKDMRSASLSDGAFDSEEGDMYLDMYDKQLALNMSQGSGIGLAELLVKQLGPTVGKIANSKVTLKNSPILVNKPATISQNNKHGNQDALPLKDAGTVIDTSSVNNTPKFTHSDEFISELWPLAKRAGASLGVDPKIILAQAALETGWGQAIRQRDDGSSTHNLFNIKAGSTWKGATLNSAVEEVVDGKIVLQASKFRVYETYNASFADYVDLIKNNSRYHDALKNASDNIAYVNGLQEAGYATDPHYANKILRIADSKKIEKSLNELKVSLNQPIVK